MKTCENFLENHVSSENWVFYKLSLWTCWFLKWQSCYLQTISALNSWITFNHHQSSDMEIIIQITILKLNSLTDRALTWYWNIYCKNSIFAMKKELVLGYQLPGIPGLFHEAFSDCEQHPKALQEEKKLPEPEQVSLDRPFVPWNPRRAPHCTNHWAIQQCKSQLSLYFTMHAAWISENAARQ